MIFETTVYADNENTTCLSVVKPETNYYETGWDVYNYICNPKATGEYSYSDDCVDSMSTAQSFCKGVHITSGYKNTYHTQVFEECSEQYICEGYIYNVTCSYTYNNGCILWTDKNDPEKYRSLRVRVSGFSDYFMNLNEDLQDEIITRTQKAV